MNKKNSIKKPPPRPAKVGEQCLDSSSDETAPSIVTPCDPAASPCVALGPTADDTDPGGPTDLGDDDGVLAFVAVYIRHFLVCDQHQLTVLALWSLYNWCFNAFPTAVYLDVRSPAPQSGKTRCLKLLELLLPMPGFFAGADSRTVMDRLLVGGRDLDRIAGLHELPAPYTFLFDDCHHTFGPSKRQPLLALLNSGCDRTSSYTSGDSDYCVFGPKAFAGDSPLPRSLAARCVPIVLRRKKPSDNVDYLPIHPRWGQDGPLADFHKFFLSWIEDNLSALAEAAEHTPPRLPAGLTPAQQGCAEPLLHIADRLGGDWPEKARAAIVALFDVPQYDPEVQILDDVRNCFLANDNPDSLSTRELLHWLTSQDNRPWSTPAWNSNSGRRLGALLHPFRISSRTLYSPPQKTFKGYERSDFQDAWDSYLPPISALSAPASREACDGPEAYGSNQSVSDPSAPISSAINATDGTTD